MSRAVVLPNVRKIFAADPGHVMFEADLKGADAQVVAWEADDRSLKSAFRSGLDIHSVNAEAMYGSQFTRLPKGGHARDKIRQDCKKGVHLTNYGGSARTMAISLGWTVADSERFQRRWFEMHPAIKEWHRRVQRELDDSRTVSNRFGFRRRFFDRRDECFTEALAWIPQSTVALTTFAGAFQLERRFWPEQLSDDPSDSLEGMLLQTHDSINFQFREDHAPMIEELRTALAVSIPYLDPLTIPWDIKMSRKSWGDMELCS